MDKITLEQLAEKVRQMREAQRNYFQRKTGLDRAKRLEVQVDELLKAIPEPPKESINQGALFSLVLLMFLSSCTTRKILYAPTDPARYSGRVVTTHEKWNTKGDTVRKTFVQWRYRP